MSSPCNPSIRCFTQPIINTRMPRLDCPSASTETVLTCWPLLARHQAKKSRNSPSQSESNHPQDQAGLASRGQPLCHQALPMDEVHASRRLLKLGGCWFCCYGWVQAEIPFTGQWNRTALHLPPSPSPLFCSLALPLSPSPSLSLPLPPCLLRSCKICVVFVPVPFIL